MRSSARPPARFDRMEAAQRQQIELANQIELVRQDIARLRGQVECLHLRIRVRTEAAKGFLGRPRRPPAQPRGRRPGAARQGGAGRPGNQQCRHCPTRRSRRREPRLRGGASPAQGRQVRDAGNAFESFVGKYPDSQFQASANYWAGSAFYQGRDYAKANNFFGKVASNWPNDSRAPDAMLGLANAQADGGDAKAARATLQALASKYPSSNAAQVAKQRLAKK